MQTTYTCQTKGGQARLTQGRNAQWRMYAGEDFVGSFADAQSAVLAMALGNCKWPVGVKPADWKVPSVLSGWAMRID